MANQAMTTISSFFAESIKKDFTFFDRVKNLPFSKQNQQFPYGIIAYCFSGSARLIIDGQQRVFEKEHVMIILPDQMVELESISVDFEVTFGVMVHELLDFLVYRFPRYVFYSISKIPIFKISEKSMLSVGSYGRLIRGLYYDTCNIFQKDMMMSLFYALFLELYECFQENDLLSSIQLSPSERIIENFQQQVFKNINYQYPVSFYAAELNISPAHLNRVVKKSKGFGAKQYIVRIMLLEIKQLLVHSNLSIKDISKRFHFKSADAFHHFFKHAVHLSPTDYRESQNIENKLLLRKKSKIEYLEVIIQGLL